ncbi:hypothetical protein HSX37_10765|uniref:Uncharacterized protein n=1 Tax=Dendrosporobacter quercicolus TaxID=146817 RepID=A0A1G9T5N6_9FIRM|nr:hypothetical protein [Dendrosporobacter quercicolus]NSL48512.1 hypothetical protein [Dendrosporobacter quercicolus DSM 1736]SDM43001.1 hypothetical protein SAMN04488502_104221 [Dendrosporobacter quercicolus]
MDKLIARIADVLEKLDRVPVELRVESPLINELEFLLEQYKEYKKEQKSTQGIR